jgi:glutaminyl-peptide cyclotransferase
MSKFLWSALVALAATGVAHPQKLPNRTPRSGPQGAPGTTNVINGQRAFEYTREAVAFGPRYLDSPGHAKVEQFIKAKLANDHLEVDSFTMPTPLGPKQMRNYIAKFPGEKDGIVVIAGHYDTLYGKKDFVGANDGGSSTGLPLALADYYRARTNGGKKLPGYSVWIVLLDGEEAVKQWTDTDSVYGARHLAQKWRQDGTAAKVKAFLLVDMVGDKDLQLEDDGNSTLVLKQMAYKAAEQRGTQSHFFRRQNQVGDDHGPFAAIGIPVLDLIDFDYGYNNAYWHTPQDTMDKLSAASLQIVGDVVIDVVRMLGERGGVQ